MMHQVAEKSWRCVFQVLCCPFGASAEEGMPKHRAQNQPTVEDRNAQVVQRTPPTFLILNISNSSLSNCIIGNNSHLTTEAECRALLQTPEQEMHGEEMRSCDQQGAAPTSPPAPSSSSPPAPSPPSPPAPSPPPPSPPLVHSGTVSIHRSSCVIIGDCNSMHAETCDCQVQSRDATLK